MELPSDRQLQELAEELGLRLRQAGWLLATAESCTGGWVAQTCTAIAGSSEWFERGFVAYSNDAKQELLGVPAQTIAAHGAVSEATARAMAEGALAHSRAHASIAVTGIAGPSGGTAEKPVGTVWFAWALKQGGTVSELRLFSGDREAIRRQSVAVALDGLQRHLAVRA